MDENRTYWHDWAHFLHRFGMDGITAAFLDATAPLSFLGAQMVYLGGPFLQSSLSPEQVQALANLLEDPRELKQFTAYLREGKPF